MKIKKGGAACINIMEYFKAARVKYLHETITTENQSASTFFESALKLIEIDKKSIPKMAPWEISALSKLVGNSWLKFWERTLKEFDEVRSSEYKNKYSQKDIESDITKLNTRSNEYRIKTNIWGRWKNRR